MYGFQSSGSLLPPVRAHGERLHSSYPAKADTGTGSVNLRTTFPGNRMLRPSHLLKNRQIIDSSPDRV
jgi:hypothetical protein